MKKTTNKPETTGTRKKKEERRKEKRERNKEKRKEKKNEEKQTKEKAQEKDEIKKKEKEERKESKKKKQKQKKNKERIFCVIRFAMAQACPGRAKSTHFMISLLASHTFFLLGFKEKIRYFLEASCCSKMTICLILINY